MLRHLQVHPGVTHAMLAAHFGVSTPAISTRISRLAAHGLVRKQRNGHRVANYLTAKGKKMAESEEQAVAEVVLAVIAKHPGLGLREISRLLGKSPTATHFQVQRLKASGKLRNKKGAGRRLQLYAR